jgi:hypothetical protein
MLEFIAESKRGVCPDISHSRTSRTPLTTG